MAPPSRRSPRLRARGALAGAALACLALTGCASVNQAVTQGQEALDTASQAVDSAQGLIDAGAQLGAACVAAQAAWVPGVSAAEAYATIDEAAGVVDGVLAANPALPGVAEIDQALTTAREAVGSDQTSFGVARQTLQTACALVSMGG